MKILHCADIHIGSSCQGVDNAVQRRRELIDCFDKMVEFANNSNIAVVIIAGDLFDNDSVNVQEIASIISIIKRYPIEYYILKGNHGGDRAYTRLTNGGCDNVHFFADSWTYYNNGNIVIVGSEQLTMQHYDNLILDANSYNIVVAHGDVSNNSYGIVDTKLMADKGANYVALGHRHSYQTFRHKSCTACYCGVLETRGFDEIADSGFVVLDTDSGKHQHIVQCKRKVVGIDVDTTSAQSEIDLVDIVNKAVGNVDSGNYLNLTLKGTLDRNIAIDYVKEKLQGRFFALRIDNKTRVNIDIQSIRQEQSLRAEVLKLAETIPDDEQRNDVERLAIATLAGEDIVW